MVVPSKEFFEEYDEKQRQRYTKAKHDFDILLANGNHCPDWRAECFEVVKSKADSVGFVIESPFDYLSADDVARFSPLFERAVQSNSIHVYTDSLHTYGSVFCVADEFDMNFLSKYLDMKHLSETWVTPYGIAWLTDKVGIGIVKPDIGIFRDVQCVPLSTSDDLERACFGVYLSLCRIDCLFRLSLSLSERKAIYFRRQCFWMDGNYRKPSLSTTHSLKADGLVTARGFPEKFL